MSEQYKKSLETLINQILEVAEHLQVDNGKLTAAEQYDLGEQLYSATRDFEDSAASFAEINAVAKSPIEKKLIDALEKIKHQLRDSDSKYISRMGFFGSDLTDISLTIKLLRDSSAAAKKIADEALNASLALEVIESDDRAVEIVARALWRERQRFAKKVFCIDIENYGTAISSGVNVAQANNVLGEARTAVEAFKKFSQATQIAGGDK